MRQTSRQFFQHHFQFKACEGRAQTQVRTVPKREVAARVIALDVKALAVGEYRRVVICRAAVNEKLRPRGNFDALQRNRFARLPPPGDHRRYRPQAFFYRIWDQCRLRTKCSPLRAVFEQATERVARLAGGRFVARIEEIRQQARDVLFREELGFSTWASM